VLFGSDFIVVLPEEEFTQAIEEKANRAACSGLVF